MAALLLLTGCAGSVDGDASDGVDGGPAPDLVAAGFPEGFSCLTVEKEASTFTTGLFFNTASVEGDRQMACTWSDIPLDTLVPIYDDKSTELDVIIRIDFQRDTDAERQEQACKTDATSSVGMEVFMGEGECAGGTFAGDPEDAGLWAAIAHFELSLITSCDMSSVCAPVLPASFTDTAGFAALRGIADALTDGLEFVEPVIVSDAENGPDFVRDWAEAGFPSHSTTAEWYCPLWPMEDSVMYYDWLEQDAHREGYTWTVSDELNTERIFPEVMLSFTASAGDSLDYAVALSADGPRTFCIADIQSLNG